MWLLALQFVPFPKSSCFLPSWDTKSQEGSSYANSLLIENCCQPQFLGIDLLEDKLRSLYFLVDKAFLFFFFWSSDASPQTHASFLYFDSRQGEEEFKENQVGGFNISTKEPTPLPEREAVLVRSPADLFQPESV